MKIKLLIKIIILNSFLVIITNNLLAKILIPMDLTQTNHLKAYGIAFYSLQKGKNVEWLLNYKGGSFLFDDWDKIIELCQIRGVKFNIVSSSEVALIKKTIEEENMESILLEKEPKIAVYVPPTEDPWDDAVRLALDYAEIPYETIYDEDIVAGKLQKYDWLHLHHEDFTGQFGKFYTYKDRPWYKNQVKEANETAKKLGFKNPPALKLEIVKLIKDFVQNGGFLFAMCGATDSFDIALAADGVDIVDIPYDGTPPDPNADKKLDFSKTIFFKDFKLVTSPYIYEFSDIDITEKKQMSGISPEADYFTLFDFSAKYDPVPTMLVQNHVSVVKDFYGQTTGFNRDKLKDNTIILAEVPNSYEVKYIHTSVGKGTVTFYGGHDPEDYQHLLEDPPTKLELHPNSPGYRLILNNVLFPASKKKKIKT